MHLEYSVTADDYADAILLDRSHQSFFARWRAFCLMLVVPSVYLATGEVGEVARDLGPVSLAIPILLAIAFDAFLRSRRRLKRLFSKSGLGRPLGAQIDERGLEFHDVHSNGLIKWSGVLRWLESSSLFLFYIQPRRFVVVPKRAFQPEEVERCRSLLLEQVGSHAVLRKHDALS